MRGMLTLALLALPLLAGCARSPGTQHVPTAKDQACARAFKLDPEQPSACVARSGPNCFVSVEDACACAGCGSCMVFESVPMLVSCKKR